MRKPATVKAVVASRNSSSKEPIISKATLPIKCKARQDGRRLARILNTISSGMDTFDRLYHAYTMAYPFHRDELLKAFREAL